MDAKYSMVIMYIKDANNFRRSLSPLYFGIEIGVLILRA